MKMVSFGALSILLTGELTRDEKAKAKLYVDMFKELKTAGWDTYILQFQNASVDFFSEFDKR